MQLIFGSGQATGRYAMGSNEPLDNPVDFSESNVTFEGFTIEKSASVDGGAGLGSGAGTSTSATPNGAGLAYGSQGTKQAEEPAVLGKRRRSMVEDEVGVMHGLTIVVLSVAEAFKAPVVVQKAELPPNLYCLCMATPGFLDEDLMAALTHLMDNKRQGEGFVTMSKPHRVLWIRQYLAKLREEVACEAHDSDSK